MGSLVRWSWSSRLICKQICLQGAVRCESTRCFVGIPGSSEVPLEFETGHMARFADGAVVASQGDNAVLATVVGKQEHGNGPASFVPLSVDFRQSAAALGRIPTNYLRRELRQTDADILASRLIDRSIRPLFPKCYSGGTQVICKPLALDDSGDGVLLGLNAASAALAVSDIPWDGPVGAVRVGIIDDKIVLNPCREALKGSSLNMIVTGCADGERAVMIDMDGKELSIERIEECLDVAFVAIAEITKAISTMRKQAGKPKRPAEERSTDEKLKEEVWNLSNERLYYILTDVSHDKTSRDEAIMKVADDVVSSLPDENENDVRFTFHSLVKKTLRDLVLETNVRCDGRGLTDFRPINIAVDVYKKLHGSALFQRGQTQVIGTVTFDSPSAAFHPDSISQLLGAQQRKMFMLHYEFPSFATNEISSSPTARRRELGHGALAEKALKHVVPDQFPYSIRLACQVLESNGSSSMASVCVGSLSLRDAGVPISAPVAGVAVGLITNDDLSEHRILSDILGIEDYAGDMDFKIAGTSKGITAIQMDLKLPGIRREILSEAMAQGQEGIAHLLGLMNKVQPNVRSEFKSSVPVMENIPVPIFKRHALFRNGGYNAKLIEAETGVKISVEDDANISMLAPNKEKLEAAKEMLEKMFSEDMEKELTFGALYKAEIVEILEHGVLVALKKGMRPMLLKNSNLDARRVAHASALGLEVGSVITVQYLGRDAATGHHRISRKMLQTATLPIETLGRR